MNIENTSNDRPILFELLDNFLNKKQNSKFNNVPDNKALIIETPQTNVIKENKNNNISKKIEYKDTQKISPIDRYSDLKNNSNSKDDNNSIKELSNNINDMTNKNDITESNDCDILNKSCIAKEFTCDSLYLSENFDFNEEAMDPNDE